MVTPKQGDAYVVEAQTRAAFNRRLLSASEAGFEPAPESFTIYNGTFYVMVVRKTDEEEYGDHMPPVAELRPDDILYEANEAEIKPRRHPGGF